MLLVAPAQRDLLSARRPPLHLDRVANRRACRRHAKASDLGRHCRHRDHHILEDFLLPVAGLQGVIGSLGGRKGAAACGGQVAKGGHPHLRGSAGLPAHGDILAALHAGGRNFKDLDLWRTHAGTQAADHIGAAGGFALLGGQGKGGVAAQFDLPRAAGGHHSKRSQAHTLGILYVPAHCNHFADFGVGRRNRKRRDPWQRQGGSHCDLLGALGQPAACHQRIGLFGSQPRKFMCPLLPKLYMRQFQYLHLLGPRRLPREGKRLAFGGRRALQREGFYAGGLRRPHRAAEESQQQHTCRPERHAGPLPQLRAGLHTCLRWGPSRTFAGTGVGHRCQRHFTAP